MKIKDPIEEFVLLRAMKLTRLILFIGFLQVSAVTTAQRLPISIKNSALEKWFSEIEKKTDYTFFYDATILQHAKPITVEMKDASVEEVLQVSLNGLGVSGVVQPESGIPLAGVTVSIKKIKKLGVTHEVGKFDPKDVPNGEYEVKISYVGLVDESSGRDRG